MAEPAEHDRLRERAATAVEDVVARLAPLCRLVNGWLVVSVVLGLIAAMLVVPPLDSTLARIVATVAVFVPALLVAGARLALRRAVAVAPVAAAELVGIIRNPAAPLRTALDDLAGLERRGQVRQLVGVARWVGRTREVLADHAEQTLTLGAALSSAGSLAWWALLASPVVALGALVVGAVLRF